MTKVGGRPGWLGWLAFAVTAGCALCIGFVVDVILLMGECLPRDGSAAMLACDTAKRINVLLYPSLLLVLLVAAGILHASRRWPGLALSILSPFVSVPPLLLVERLVG